MSGVKQRVTLSNLSEPQQVRELNRQLSWIWDQLLGGLSMKSLNASARAVIDSKASGEEVESVVRQTADEIWMEVRKPAAGLDTKNGVVINEKGVYVTGGEVDLRTNDGAQYLNVTPECVEASEVRSPTVAPRYAGMTVLTVDPNATEEQMQAWGVYRSLSDALTALSHRQIDGKVSVNIADGAVLYGDAVIEGVCGGEIEINGVDVILHGSLSIHKCGCKVQIGKLSVVSGARKALEVNGCAYVGLWACRLSSEGAEAVEISDGSRVYAVECVLRSGIGRAAMVKNAAFGVFVNCVGSGELAVQFASLSAMGTVPVGGCSDWGGSLMSAANVVETGADEEAPEAQEQTTAHYPMMHSDSYAGGTWSWFDDADIRQGITGDSGRIYGCMWFDAAAIRAQLAGKTVNQVGLRLKMLSGYGRGVSVAMQLYGTDMEYDGRSGEPELVTQYGTIGSAVPGEVNTITVPNRVAEDLAAGVICGLVLLSDDTEKYKERAYSKNYARFDGRIVGAEDTVPTLTVVYGSANPNAAAGGS